MRRSRQSARVKTSMRRPCYLSKKREKNKKKNKRKTRSADSLCKIACRCSMEERKPLNSKPRVLIMQSGHLTSTPLQEYSFSPRYVQFYYSLSLLQEDADFLQEDANFLQEGADSLQETQPFYRKPCISTGNFLKKPRTVHNPCYEKV